MDANFPPVTQLWLTLDHVWFADLFLFRLQNEVKYQKQYLKSNREDVWKMPVVAQTAAGKTGRQNLLCLCGVAEGSRTTEEPGHHFQVIRFYSKQFQEMLCAEFASFFSPFCTHMDTHLCSSSWEQEPKHKGLFQTAEFLKRLKSKMNGKFCLWPM